MEHIHLYFIWYVLCVYKSLSKRIFQSSAMSVEKSGIKFSWHPFLGLFHPFVKNKHLESIRKLHRLALSQLDPLNYKKDQIDVLQTNANVKSKIIYQVHCFPPRNFLFLSVILAEELLQMDKLQLQQSAE